MRHDFIDRFSRIDSPIHRIATSVKVLAAFIAVIGAIILPISFLWYFLFHGFILIVAAFVSRIPKLFLVKRLLLMEPFVLGISVLVLFQPGGIGTFINVVIKSTLCLSTMLLLSNTTPFSELLSFLKKLYIPGLLVTILALMYRYLFVLIDEAEKMQRARESRTFTRNNSQIWKTRAILIAQLFVRSTERAERIYLAMLARGWK
jgi:cobalt/nickel transport system permease protein